MQLVKVFQCNLSDSISATYTEYMHFRAGTPNCLHYSMITYGYCDSVIHMLSNCGHQDSRRVDSLTEAIAEAQAVTGTAPLPLSFSVLAKCSRSGSCRKTYKRPLLEVLFPLQIF